MTYQRGIGGLLLGVVLMCASVCRADSHEGRLYNEIEAMGIAGSSEVLAPVDDGGLDQPLPPLTFGDGECTVPQVPLPAAVWAGLAGGAGVFLKRRR